MADTVYLLAQTTTSSAATEAEHGTVVVEEHANAPAGEAHATTEAEGGHAKIVFPPFDTTTFASQILWFAITFGALYLLMSRVALPQIGSIIDKRKARIEGDLREAERLRGETDKAVAAYEQALADARKNAHSIAEETRNSIKSDLDGKRKVVEDDLSKKVTEAEARISANKNEAMGRVSEIAAETAAAVVMQLTGEANQAEINAAVAAAVKG
jgi:F-type H+-transporting ATPase subunit b